MTVEEIERILPQRKPMLLVDEMWMDGEYSVSKYRVTGDEFFLQGHFPGNPVVPGVMLCEIMGQGSAILLADKLEGNALPMFVGMDRVRFKQQAKPGDVIETKARLSQIRGNIIFVDAKATVNGKLCCSALLTVALVNKDF